MELIGHKGVGTSVRLSAGPSGAGAEAVAQRTDDQAYQDRCGYGCYVDVRDFARAQMKFFRDQGHQRRTRKPREEADEECNPGQVKHTHRDGAQAEDIDAGRFA